MNVMRVHVLGRSYYDYGYSLWLRRLGVESRFFHEVWLHPRLALAWEFTELSDEDLAYIHPVDFLGVSPLGGQGAEILRRISDCDVMMCTGLSGWWAYLSGVPYVYQQFGGDLHTWPYMDKTPEEIARARVIRQILAGASVLCGFRHLKINADRMAGLGLDPGRYRPFAFPVDTARYAPLHGSARERLREELSADGKFVVFLPSQLMFKSVHSLRYTKGTDVFIEGVRLFRQRLDPPEMVLWVTDRGWQREECFAMLRAFGLEDCVRPMPVVNKERMIRLLQAADVILDQINPDFGNCGGLTVEAMACGRCVVGHVDREHRRTVALEPDIPIVEALTARDVADALECLYSDAAARRENEAASRQYAAVCHEPLTVARYYARIFEEVSGVSDARFADYGFPGASRGGDLGQGM
jgi:glycosyltransferase involved in cell wall biosynthesis